MPKLYFRLALLTSVLLAGNGVYAQPAHREFGWSLRVESTEKKKKASKPPRNSIPAASTDEIRVDTALVLSDLRVQDKNGLAIDGLRAGDFEISESGSPQKIDVFAYGDSSVPRSIILVIDHSLSQLQHIDMSIASAKVLVDSLRPTDRMAIVSDDIELISDLTSDKEQLKTALEGLRIKCNDGRFGKSSQYSALFAALNERISRNGTRNIVIFQTDGDELSLIRRKAAPGTTNFGIENIVSAAERKGVTIYTVYTGSRLENRPRQERYEHTRREIDDRIRAFARVSGRPPPANTAKLSKDYVYARAEMTMAEEKAVASLATGTGGIAQSLESPDQAAAVYERILADIGRRYLIGYYPSERSENAAREREVRVTLKSKGNFRIIGGRTYIDY